MSNLDNNFWVDCKFPFYHFVSLKPLENLRDQENQKKLFNQIDFDNKNIVTAEQIHGNRVVAVNRSHENQQIRDVDGLVTEEPNMGLVIFTADCMPLFLGDKKKRIVGLVHAGWRGLSKGIISETLEVINKNFGINPDELIFNIGPHIRQCCYQIGDEVRDAFKISNDISFINLCDIAEKQLKDLGIKTIYKNDLCTCCKKDLFFSYRRNKTNKRMMSFITRMAK